MRVWEVLLLPSLRFFSFSRAREKVIRRLRFVKRFNCVDFYCMNRASASWWRNALQINLPRSVLSSSIHERDSLIDDVVDGLNSDDIAGLNQTAKDWTGYDSLSLPGYLRLLRRAMLFFPIFFTRRWFKKFPKEEVSHHFCHVGLQWSSAVCLSGFQLN